MLGSSLSFLFSLPLSICFSGLKLLASRARHLCALDISDCSGVTNAGVEVLACLPLERIALSRCHLVTVAAMRKMAALPTLKAINIFGCYSIVLPHLKVKRAREQVLPLWTSLDALAEAHSSTPVCQKQEVNKDLEVNAHHSGFMPVVTFKPMRRRLL